MSNRTDFKPWQDDLAISGAEFLVPTTIPVWPLNLVYLNRKKRTRLWAEKRTPLKRDLQTAIITCPEFLVADYRGLDFFTNGRYIDTDGISCENGEWITASDANARFEILLKLMNAPTLYAAQFNSSNVPEILQLLAKHGFIAMLFEHTLWYKREMNFWTIGAIVKIRSLIYA